MTWLAWRQQRIETLVALGILGLLLVLFVPTGIRLSSHFANDEIGACLSTSASAGCAERVDGFQQHFKTLQDITSWFGILPILIGILFAAPLILELERGTYRLAWTQSISRERWIGVASVEILDDLGRPVGSIGILIDITERKQAEEAMRRAKEGLEGRIAERTAEFEMVVRELESFTYSISHDLRAPLRAIEGFSRILEEDHVQELQGDGPSHLSRVRAAAIRMDMLINDLLVFARLNQQTMSRQQVDLNALVRQALEELKLEQSNRQIRIQHRELPPVYGDQELLRQVVRHLISNALKYTRRREVAEIEVGWREEANEIVYFVKDNGTGFDMAYAEKLFGVFQKLHRTEEFEGSGVGLAIAHRILRRHGGRIWALSEVDRGAAFFFTLPPPVREPRPSSFQGV